MAFVRRCYGEFNETANGFKSAAFGMISSPANWMKTRKCTPSTSRVKGIFDGIGGPMGGNTDPVELVEAIKGQKTEKTCIS
jgi:hypothetical protein